ncbi:YpmS family protein [Neobacillus sp. PS3-34]|uniref:YpmS family protein n=1 Tax=Neobacillus sp. PS3-34 TaxID=3070678 RepID=UPI0027DFAFAF|nr:YpmS family protein [Neobacillus sp. PS3-34]WML47838.1 YpmS family protein [Neobacillus sp. PS3-34]
MKNKWKSGFILLLGINLLIIAVLLVFISLPPKDEGTKKFTAPKKDFVSFYVKSNKQDINKLIKYYIQKETPDSPINYQINLDDEVELYGLLPFFNDELKMKLTFEPEALDNGDLVLKQKSISLGRLHLPVPYVLKFISENYKLPKGVDIQPNKRLVYISMQQVKLKSDTKVKVNTFNLKKDDISFTLLVPVK